MFSRRFGVERAAGPGVPDLSGDIVVADEKLLVDHKQRIRDVRRGPNGGLSVFAGNSLLRVTLSKQERVGTR